LGRAPDDRPRAETDRRPGPGEVVEHLDPDDRLPGIAPLTAGLRLGQLVRDLAANDRLVRFLVLGQPPVGLAPAEAGLGLLVEAGQFGGGLDSGGPAQLAAVGIDDDEGRDALDLVAFGEPGAPINIDGADRVTLAFQLADDRLHRLARAAPGRAEVE